MYLSLKFMSLALLAIDQVEVLENVGRDSHLARLEPCNHLQISTEDIPYPRWFRHAHGRTAFAL